MPLLGFGQVDYFNVDGSWAGNDANGNAVIKWQIEICAGPLGKNVITVAVPSFEADDDKDLSAIAEYFLKEFQFILQKYL